MPTEIRILIADSALLFSLYRWLDADAYTHLDPGTRIALTPTAQAVTATVTGVASLRGLAQSYSAWHSSRLSPDPCKVTFHAAQSNAAVTVTEGSMRAIEAIAALVAD
jgi:Effector Associated Constant Component 1